MTNKNFLILKFSLKLREVNIFLAILQKTQNYIDSFYKAANSTKFYIIVITHDSIIVMHNHKSIPIKTIHQLDHYIKKHLEEIKQTWLMIDDHDLEDWHPGFLGDITNINL